jgi:dienelactone hydrolase
MPRLAYFSFILGLHCVQLSNSFQPISSVPKYHHMNTHNTGHSTSTSRSALTWNPLETLMNIKNPSEICTASKDKPRLAKDVEYASAVLEAWKKDAQSYHPNGQNVGSRCVYHESNGKMDLNGYIVAPSDLVEAGRSAQKKKEEVPAIILFHTGAGPQDVFLRWKADILAQELNCIILIADIISDSDGYAWSDRTKYDKMRKSVLEVSEEDGQIARWKLRRTIAAAIDYLKNLNFVKVGNIGAMGYCMGGHPILELGMMQVRSIKALISYHGVFDGVKEYESDPNDTSTDINTQVLICNGKNDPFVQQNDIEKAKNLLEKKGCHVTILNFTEVKHGFTNPAQDYNPSEAFAFNKDASKKSWEATLHLLRQTL